MDTDLMNDETLVDKRRVVSPSISGSESGSVVINKQPARKEIRQVELAQEVSPQKDTRGHEDDDDDNENDDDDDDDDDADDFNDYIIEPPLPPPTELHPDKLYALFDFSGDDPSHCELERDEPVTLLNDQDGYWWLVRKENNGKIGFAPAECLETYEERLARLNCWKNEELEKTSRENLDELPSELNELKLEKSNKSVTFSNDVDVADDSEYEDAEFLLQDIDREDDDDNDDDHDDYDYETPYVGAEGETVSDTFPIVTPLTLTKKSKDLSNKKNFTIPFSESDIEETSPLVAPNASFFNQNNFSGSIGSYSPSSSEFESPETTPHLNQYPNRKKPSVPIDEIKANIPQSIGTINIAHSIKMLDDLMNDELNENDLNFDTEREIDSTDDNTISFYYDDHDSSKLSSPIDLPNEKVSPKKSVLSNARDTSFSNSNISLQLSQSTTIDGSAIMEESNPPLSKTEPLHPDIDLIYKESFSKFDELAAKLERFSELMK